MPFYGWLILALVLFGAEVFVPGMFLAGFGVAALLTSVASLLGAPVAVQWGVFALFSLISIPLLRPLARLLTRPSPRRLYIDELVGKEAFVLQTVDRRTNTGIVRVEGEEWRAESDEVIEQGKTVFILEVRGNRLLVTTTPVFKGPKPLP